MGTRERRPRRGPGRLLGCTEGPAGLKELATTCPPTPRHLSLVPRVVLVFIWCTFACRPLRSSSNPSRLFYLFHFLTKNDIGVVTGSPFPSFANFCFFFFLFSLKKHAISTIAFLCYLQRLRVAHHPGARESRARKAGQKVRTDVQDASFQRY